MWQGLLDSVIFQQRGVLPIHIQHVVLEPIAYEVEERNVHRLVGILVAGEKLGKFCRKIVVLCAVLRQPWKAG